MMQLRPLLVNSHIVNQTLLFFSKYTQRKLEAGCIWYGLSLDDFDLVLKLGIPRQSNFSRYYLVDTEDLSRLTIDATDRFEAMAQVHSHPGSDVRHSGFDDEMIVSKNIYSLVFPNYGGVPVEMDKIGIHFHDGQEWKILDRNKNSSLLILYPSVVDKR